jgi:hypothetical protein
VCVRQTWVLLVGKTISVPAPTPILSVRVRPPLLSEPSEYRLLSEERDPGEENNLKRILEFYTFWGPLCAAGLRGSLRTARVFILLVGYRYINFISPLVWHNSKAIKAGSTCPARCNSAESTTLALDITQRSSHPTAGRLVSVPSIN